MSAIVRLTLLAALLFGRSMPAADDPLATAGPKVLEKYCYACHGKDGSSKGGFHFVLERDLLVTRGLLMPGKPEASEIFRKVQAGEMPPANKPKPSDTEVSLLREWIAKGAPSAAQPVVTRIGSDAVTRMIHRDLLTYPKPQRRFLRYASFAAWHNSGRPRSDVLLAGPALAKLLNSLSWHAKISKPVPLDAAQTVFRIDLRDYRWTARHWERLVTAYPYRQAPGDDLARACAEETGVDQFLLRGDWLVATASRGKLYYDLLELPATDKAIERLVQVDAARGVREATLLRSGFNGSGVSKNNRLLERHDALFGALWRSYDFSDNTERQNVFENPLPPTSGRHAFRPAGGEMIFHLPNGMQAFFVTDANGQRVEKAPVEIVSDPQRPDRQVEVGLSCMTCHHRGLIPKEDQVRAHVEKNAAAFPREVVETVRTFHSPWRKFRGAIEADNQRYLAALETAGVKPEEPDPVSTVTLRYESVADRDLVAAEFGFTTDDFTKRLAASASLQRQVGALQAKGGTVQRQLLEEKHDRLVADLGPAPVIMENPVVARKVELPEAYTGHREAVLCVALSADGTRAVSGGQDQTLRVWDVATGKLLRTLEGHTSEILCVALSADGTRAITGSADRTLRVWDLGSGKELFVLRGHLERVRAVAISADGKQALSAGQDRSVRMWDLTRGTELRALTGHGTTITCLTLSRDGARALTGGNDGKVHLWDLAKGRLIERWEAHPRGVTAVAFHPDGERVASAGEDRLLRIWDVTNLKTIHNLSGHVNAPVNVRFTADGKRLVSAGGQTDGGENFLRVWDVGTGKALLTRGGAESVWCAVIDAEGRFALTGGADRKLRPWTLDVPR